jgi:hypothetical protein
MRRIWVLVLSAGAGIAGAQTAHLPSVPAGLSPAERSANIESFEQVWTTVRDKHWDPKLNGVDWQAVHDELRPKMEAAKNMDAAREVLNDMVGRLKQTHFGIFPGDVYRIPYAYCYRCDYGKTPDTCGVECVKAIETELFRTTVPAEEVAAIFVQSWVGSIK